MLLCKLRENVGKMAQGLFQTLEITLDPELQHSGPVFRVVLDVYTCLDGWDEGSAHSGCYYDIATTHGAGVPVVVAT